MSGIAGSLSSDETLTLPSSLVADVKVLLDALKHRGRRGQGTWQGPGCALGALVSVAMPEALAEDQPLVDGATGLILVWHGRLDNRDELLRSLASPGETLTDAQLVLRAFGRWDVECAGQLIGDFAFAVWDSRSRALYAARDPLGLRPFFYFADGERFCFSSEIQALLRLSVVPREIDEVMVSEYLLWWTDYPEPERTFFRSLHRLPPAHWLRWTAHGLESRRYWEIDTNRQLRYPRQEYLEQFGSLLSQAVACRMRTPGRVGIFLSGGLDSASVASLASRQAKPADPLRAYCMQLLDDRDESPLAELVARRAGMEFHRLPYAAESYLEGLETHIRQLAVPFTDEGWVHERNLFAKAAGDGCNVVLTGDGGDELFTFAWGYVADLVRKLRGRGLLADLNRFSDYYGCSPFDMLWRSVPYLLPRSSLRVWKFLRWRKAPAWINPALAVRTELLRRLRRVRLRRRFDSISAELDHHVITRGRMVLVHERRELTSAHQGIELRCPFYDRRLLEFMLAVPWDLKVKDGQVKPFLREIPGLLPEALRNLHKKSDYSNVNEVLIRKGDQAALRELFRVPPADAALYVDLAKAKATCEAFLSGDNTQLRPTWVFACFFLWLGSFGSCARWPPGNFHRAAFA